jgi:hypothetical protein
MYSRRYNVKLTHYLPTKGLSIVANNGASSAGQE